MPVITELSPVSRASDALEREDLFPIREVSRLTGVNPVTLRAWERRYGLIEPTRTESGHRLYSMTEIERVRSIVEWIDRGVSVSKVGEILDLGVKAGIVEKSGAWFSYDSQRLGQGRENSKAFLKANPDMTAKIEASIRQNSAAAESFKPVSTGWISTSLSAGLTMPMVSALRSSVRAAAMSQGGKSWSSLSGMRPKWRRYI